MTETDEVERATYEQLADQMASKGAVSVRRDRLTSQEADVWRRLMSRVLRRRKMPFRSFLGSRDIVFYAPDYFSRSNQEISPSMRLAVNAMGASSEGDTAKADRLKAQIEEMQWFALIPSENGPAATKGGMQPGEEAREIVFDADNGGNRAWIDPENDSVIHIVSPRSKPWTIPNFAKLFGDDEVLTPRTALALYLTLGPLGDHASDDLEEIGDRPVTRQSDGNWGIFTSLPPISWGTSGIFRQRIARVFDDLAKDLATGDWPEPRNTAEEICLHLAIEDASQVYMDMMGDGYSAEIITLLPANENDYDWGLLSDVLFQDEDYMFLWEADGEMKGIESTDHPVNAQMGMGDKRVESWFETFVNMTPRNPRRGFRR